MMPLHLPMQQSRPSGAGYFVPLVDHLDALCIHRASIETLRACSAMSKPASSFQPDSSE
jgi:hypothetical protein